MIICLIGFLMSMTGLSITIESFSYVTNVNDDNNEENISVGTRIIDSNQVTNMARDYKLIRENKLARDYKLASNDKLTSHHKLAFIIEVDGDVHQFGEFITQQYPSFELRS